MVLKREINLYKTPNDVNVEREAIFEEQTFLIEEPGIYSIEGPNQVGKSVLIKLLVGALPPNFDKELSVSLTYINGKPQKINSVIDAINNGMVAVFQEETLVPTMTVREQILMRHSNPKIRVVSDQLIGRLWNEMFLTMIRNKISFISTPDLEKYEYRYRELPSKEVETSLLELLNSYGHPDITEKLPMELSSGQKAIVRLISAQLYRNINILFLDEVLANIDNDTRKKIIFNLKGWCEENHNKSIVVVTHNKEEKLLWKPKKEFKIKNRKITSSKIKNHFSVHLALPKKHDTIPIYKYPYPTPLILNNKYSGQSFMITTENIISSYEDEINHVKNILIDISGTNPEVIIVPSGEEGKNHENLFPAVENILNFIDSKNKLGVIASVGGGALLNFGGFVTSILFRGSAAYIVVPTNLTALSDVVIGSKPSINYKTLDGDYFKNALGVYSDPTAILIDHNFMDSLNPENKRLGLVECLKHGLLQDSDLFSKTYELILSKNPNINECISVAERVLEFKGDVLSRHPWETEGGRILRYGHVFAHAMERVSKFTIPHPLSVLWGILVELKLAGHPDIFERLVNLLLKTAELNHNKCTKINCTDFLKELNKETYYPVRPYPAIELPKIGYYSFPNKEFVLEKNVSLEEIESAVNYINKILL
ncbi:MAG: hypothetical protein A2X62_06800 [Stygiobacter sp. GWC2_38_9]|nr:MAG: hypothetical protein A2X62_06800 [Stygiobacter sp. GWC2_38_9]